jgi:hypothetical protein
VRVYGIEELLDGISGEAVVVKGLVAPGLHRHIRHELEESRQEAEELEAASLRGEGAVGK